MLQSKIGLLSHSANLGLSFRLAQRLAVVGQRAQGLRFASTKKAPTYMPDIEGSSAPYTIQRDLPDPRKGQRKQMWYFGIFCVTMGVTLFGMLKYEAANSPIVTSTLYTLRRSPHAIEKLGDEIRFASTMPWIDGEVSLGKARVDFSYLVHGNKANGRVVFAARRNPHEEYFKALKWGFETEDGDYVDLMGEDYHPFVPGPRDEPGMRPAASS